MRAASGLVFPYDPEYTGHWEAEKRREETREWLRQCERKRDAPRGVPGIPEMNIPAGQSRRFALRRPSSLQSVDERKRDAPVPGIPEVNIPAGRRAGDSH
jgi:hypothetical protein